jgi:hypothetical protein
VGTPQGRSVRRSTAAPPRNAASPVAVYHEEMKAGRALRALRVFFMHFRHPAPGSPPDGRSSGGASYRGPYSRLSRASRPGRQYSRLWRLDPTIFGRKATLVDDDVARSHTAWSGGWCSRGRLRRWSGSGPPRGAIRKEARNRIPGRLLTRQLLYQNDRSLRINDLRGGEVVLYRVLWGSDLTGPSTKSTRG